MNIEKEARIKRRGKNLRATILATVGIAGVIAISAIAPGAARLLKNTGLTSRLRYNTKRVLARLKQKGEIEFIKEDGKTFIRLTEKGEQAFALTKEKLRIVQNKSRKWDRRYRLVMFDIPEHRKRIRDMLRIEMREIGFLRLQDSAWLYPHDCEEFIALLKADLHIGKDVLYAVVESIENDGWIRKHFELAD